MEDARRREAEPQLPRLPRASAFLLRPGGRQCQGSGLLGAGHAQPGHVRAGRRGQLRAVAQVAAGVPGRVQVRRRTRSADGRLPRGCPACRAAVGGSRCRVDLVRLFCGPVSGGCPAGPRAVRRRADRTARRHVRRNVDRVRGPPLPQLDRQVPPRLPGPTSGQRSGNQGHRSRHELVRRQLPQPPRHHRPQSGGTRSQWARPRRPRSWGSGRRAQVGRGGSARRAAPQPLAGPGRPRGSRPARSADPRHLGARRRGGRRSVRRGVGGCRRHTGRRG